MVRNVEEVFSFVGFKFFNYVNCMTPSLNVLRGTPPTKEFFSLSLCLCFFHGLHNFMYLSHIFLLSLSFQTKESQAFQLFLMTEKFETILVIVISISISFSSSLRPFSNGETKPECSRYRYTIY